MAERLDTPWRVAPFEKAVYQNGSRTRAFFRTLAGRVLAATITCWIIAYVFCKYQFWRDPHSTFFDSSAVYEMKYTKTREAEAKVLIDNPEIHATAANPAICVGIVSVKRKEIQYLNGTIGSLLAGLSEEERDALSVQVLFADIEPYTHPDYNTEWLNLVDYWSGYDISEEQLQRLRQYLKDDRLRPKAIFDYAYILDQCYKNTTAPYIAIFEDDIVLADSWLAKTIIALHEIRKKSTPWLYMRLWWTDVMLGWDKAIDSWYTNPIFNYIVALGLAYFAAFGLQRHSKRSRTNIDILALNILTCVTIPAFITLVFMIGHNSLFPMSGLQRMDVKGCCTQALIYPRSQVPGLVDMLRGLPLDESDQTDFLIEDYANGLDLARYALAPQLVQHVGLVSSRGTKRKDSKTNWSFYFEGFSAQKLREDHDRLLKSTSWRLAFDGLFSPEPG